LRPLPAKALGLVQLSPRRQHPGAHAPPLRLPIGILGNREPLGRPPLGQLECLLAPPLSEDGVGEVRGHAREKTELARLVVVFARRAQLVLGRRALAREELDVTGREAGVTRVASVVLQQRSRLPGECARRLEVALCRDEVRPRREKRLLDPGVDRSS
jgi:hypothetical protein